MSIDPDNVAVVLCPRHAAVDELVEALWLLRAIIGEAYEFLDRDNDMKSMKLLMAACGGIPKYRADTDKITSLLARLSEGTAVSASVSPECDAGMCSACHGCNGCDCHYDDAFLGDNEFEKEDYEGQSC